jgi:hypothetical protein
MNIFAKPPEKDMGFGMMGSPSLPKLDEEL